MGQLRCALHWPWGPANGETDEYWDSVVLFPELTVDAGGRTREVLSFSQPANG